MKEGCSIPYAVFLASVDLPIILILFIILNVIASNTIVNWLAEFYLDILGKMTILPVPFSTMNICHRFFFVCVWNDYMSYCTVGQ